MELIAKLGIDVKLLLAQIVNFLILMALLYKFAYKPVLEMLDKRQKKIEQGMKDAEKSEALLQEVQVTREKSLDQIKEQALVMLEKAAQDAAAARKQLLEKAQEEVRHLGEKAEQAIAGEKQKMLAEVRTEIVELALLVSERILGREFSEVDQKRIVAELVQEAKAKHH